MKEERSLLDAIAERLGRITERVRAEREIEERRVYLEEVLRAAPDAIVTMDASHRIVEWNPGAERLFGHSREEVMGQDIDHVVTNPDTLEEAVGFTQMVTSGKALSPLETVRYRKDGSSQSNAIEYGRQPPRVELGGRVRCDGMVCFWVRDNGLGLNPDQQARLFTPFERLDQVRAQGHGLGLSVVRRIVEKLGGQVRVASEVGQGSVFTFTLPSMDGESA